MLSTSFRPSDVLRFLWVKGSFRAVSKTLVICNIYMGVIGIILSSRIGVIYGYFIGLTNQDFMECHHIHGFC